MKYELVTERSNGTEASMTPESPPITNATMNPMAKRFAVVRRITPPHMVPTHEKILMPVGTAISSVANMIGTRSQDCMPEANMWWAQTEKPRTAIPADENATAR